MENTRKDFYVVVYNNNGTISIDPHYFVKSKKHSAKREALEYIVRVLKHAYTSDPDRKIKPIKKGKAVVGYTLESKFGTLSARINGFSSSDKWTGMPDRIPEDDRRLHRGTRGLRDVPAE